MNNIQWQGHRIMAGKVERRQQHYRVNFLYLQIKMMTIEIRTVTLMIIIQIIAKYLICAKHCAKCLTRIISFNPNSNSRI